MEYRKATLEDLEKIWNKNIAKHPDDDRWIRWKKQYIDDNKNGISQTFVVVNGDDPIGEITLVLSEKHRDVVDFPILCDGKESVYMAAFRIEKQFEGQGHISRIVKMAEEYGKSLGRKYATLGVNAENERNKAIYNHWDYNEFLFANTEEENGKTETVLYFRKEL